MATDITGTEGFNLLVGNDSFRSLSPFIAGQFTARTREQSGNLVPFAEAYYEYLDEEFNVSNRLYNLLRIADIEYGAEDPEFRQFFREELSPFFPEETKASYRIIFNRLIQFYLSKGTVPAIKFLFRAIFDTNVNIGYPVRRYIASRESQFRYESVIRYTPSLIPASDLNAVDIENSIGSSALLNYANSALLVSGNYFTSRISSVQGSFSVGQNIFFKGNPSRQIGTLRSIVANYTITNPGTGYEEGETIPLATAGDGFGFEARITKTLGSIGRIIVDDQGDGYMFPPIVEIVGDGVGATATANISTGRLTSFTITNAGSGYTRAQIRIRTNPLQTDPILVFALASARVRGSIQEIGFTDPGIDYTVAPTLNLSGMSVGSGAAITLSVGAVSTRCIDRAPRRFNGDFTSPPADQNYLMFFHMEDPTYEFTVGTTVGQFLQKQTALQNSTLMSNLIGDNQFTRSPVDTLPAGWAGNVLVKDANNSLFAGSPSTRFLVATRQGTSGPDFTCIPGEVFTTSFYAKTGSGQPYTFSMGVRWKNAAGTVISTVTTSPAPTTTTNWTYFTTTRTAPAGAAFYSVYFFIDGPSGGDLQPWAFALPTISRVLVENQSVVGFEGVVHSWNPITQELILSRSSKLSNLALFDKKLGLRLLPSLTPEDDVIAYTSSKYSRPFYIDAGDNELNREFTYYIQSPLSTSVFRQVLKDNSHPAGMNFISVIVDDLKETDQFVGMFPNGADITGVNSLRAFVEVDIMRDTRVVETRVGELDDRIISTYDNTLIFRDMEKGKMFSGSYEPEVALSPT